MCSLLVTLALGAFEFGIVTLDNLLERRSTLYRYGAKNEDEDGSSYHVAQVHSFVN